MSNGVNRDEEIHARSILEGLRSGHMPTESEASDWNSTPVIDNLRALIGAADLLWILPVLESSQDNRAGLYASLLARHAEKPEIQDALRESWELSSPYLKSVLLWRLVDDPNLPGEWHSKLFDFVLSEWEVFQKHVLKFFGGTEELVIAMSLERLHSPFTPESKKWAYLCCAAGLRAFPTAVVAIIRGGLLSDNQFNRYVAETLLSKRGP